MFNNEKGQTLLELVIVISVGTIIVVALTFATISTLRNAQFAKNQSQATKLAQEVLERVRTIRDRDSSIGGNFCSASCPGGEVTSWGDTDMWANIDNLCVGSDAYFKVDADPMGIDSLVYLGCSTNMPVSAPVTGGFTTAVIISDESGQVGSPPLGPSYTVEKTVTAVVSWTDYSGVHESRQSTYLRRL